MGVLNYLGLQGIFLGHQDEGILIHFRKTVTAPLKEEVNKLIWNNTENLLKDACADVLQIFDWYDQLSCESAINELTNIMLVVMPEILCSSAAPAGKQDHFPSILFSPPLPIEIH